MHPGFPNGRWFAARSARQPLRPETPSVLGSAARGCRRFASGQRQRRAGDAVGRLSPSPPRMLVKSLWMADRGPSSSPAAQLAVPEGDAGAVPGAAWQRIRRGPDVVPGESQRCSRAAAHSFPRLSLGALT